MYNPGHAMVITDAGRQDPITNPLSSSFIPGNRDYYADDVRDAAFYAALQAACDDLRP